MNFLVEHIQSCTLIRAPREVCSLLVLMLSLVPTCEKFRQTFMGYGYMFCNTSSFEEHIHVAIEFNMSYVC